MAGSLSRSRAWLHIGEDFSNERCHVVGGAWAHHVHDADNFVVFADEHHGAANVDGLVAQTVDGGHAAGHVAKSHARQVHLRCCGGIAYAEEKDWRFVRVSRGGTILQALLHAVRKVLRELFELLALGVASSFSVEKGSMFGDELRSVALNVVSAAGLAAFGDFGTHDFGMGGLADVGLRKQAARIDAGKNWSAIRLRGVRELVQANVVELFFRFVRDVPDADGSDSSEKKNYNQKNEKHLDKRITGFSGGNAYW
jgi:hypothetical protein